MNIVRGVFRLSLVIAALAAAYVSIDDFRQRADERGKFSQMVSTLRCGAKLDVKLLAHAKNEFGNIDLGKLGCSDKQFWANESEMQDAWSGKMEREWVGVYNSFDFTRVTMISAFAFVIANLAGLVFLAIRRTYRWVVNGFERSS